MGALRIGVVLAALVSCAGSDHLVVERHEVARVTSPTPAFVERLTFDDVQTAGIGCTGGSGGRGAVPLPSWDETRLYARHRESYACELVVGAARSVQVGCSRGEVELRADAEGRRFALRSTGVPWTVLAGGSLALARALTPDDLLAPREWADLDWAAVPSALDLLQTAYRYAAGGERGDVGQRAEALRLLQQLQAFDEPGFAPRLAALGAHDAAFDPCAAETAWQQAYATLPPVAQSQVVAALLPGLQRGAPSWQRDHVLGILSARDLLVQVGEPRAFLEHGADENVEGAVLDAWSVQSAHGAAEYACKRLAAPLALPLRAAALLAVGRAHLPCAAVRASLVGLDCRAAPIASLAEGDAAVDFVQESTAAGARVSRCFPGVSGLLAARAQPTQPTEDDLDRMCGLHD